MATEAFSSATTKTSTKIYGLFAYPGIGVSDKAFVINHTLPDILSDTIREKEIPEQLAIFENALNETQQQYDSFIVFCKTGGLPSDYAHEMIALMETYKIILKDTTFTDSIRTKIIEMAGPAQTCIKIAEEEWASALANIDDPRFAAKADDYRVICDRIIRNVMNLPHPDIQEAPEGAIIVADFLSPTDAVYFKRIKPAGLILHTGSPSGHIGDMAKGLHIPCAYIPGHKDFNSVLDSASQRAPIIDGPNGVIVTNPSCAQRTAAHKNKEKIVQREAQLSRFYMAPTVDKNGTAFNLLGTAGSVTDIRELTERKNIEHIGLWRTEMVIVSGIVPSETEQVRTYTTAFAYANGATIRARTFDFVGDKDFVGDRNPEQKYADIKTQIRALLIAAGKNNSSLEIMIPNIRLIEEVIRCKAKLRETYEELKAEGQSLPDQLPRFGIMLETPSAINNIKRIAPHIDFASVGMNDGTANFMSCDREDPHHATYQDLLRDELLYYFQELFEKLERFGVSYSLCGAPAADETLIPVWYAMGVRALSVPHGSVLEARHAISHLNKRNTDQLLQTLCDAPYEQRRSILNRFCEEHNIGFASALDIAPEAITQPALSEAAPA